MKGRPSVPITEDTYERILPLGTSVSPAATRSIACYTIATGLAVELACRAGLRNESRKGFAARGSIQGVGGLSKLDTGE